MVEPVTDESYRSFFEFLGVFVGHGFYCSFRWGVGGRCGLNPVHINELPNIHLLYHLDPSDIPHENIMDVFINFEPGFFIDKETPVDFEQEITILGHVKILVAGQRYKSTDAWIMSGFNRRLRNQLLATVNTKDLAKQFAALNKNVYKMKDSARIDGPAMIIDVAAMY